MIFVNAGGGGYYFFSHAPWDGLMFADLVFPWFMWIMGVCIPFGLKSAKKKQIPKYKTQIRILERSIKLFCIGIVLNSLGGWIDVEKYRIMGVLQRFGISYLVVASIA